MISFIFFEHYNIDGRVCAHRHTRPYIAHDYLDVLYTIATYIVHCRAGNRCWSRKTDSKTIQPITRHNKYFPKHVLRDTLDVEGRAHDMQVVICTLHASTAV